MFVVLIFLLGSGAQSFHYEFSNNDNINTGSSENVIGIGGAIVGVVGAVGVAIDSRDDDLDDGDDDDDDDSTAPASNDDPIVDIE